ncbi:MAG TPA: hypothetical protein VF644_10675 [Pyrinomonadaceae bacterium]|jgi:hypothetical protein
MQDCLKCRELNKIIKIKLPEDLKSVIRLAKQKQLENVLSVVEDRNDVWFGKQSDFDELTENNWNDLVLFKFECNCCARKFKLSCETYHGAGGDWQPIH